MKKFFVKKLVVLSLAISLTSCASALKKKCESTNWFEHGVSLAKSGKRVNSDSFVQACEREEARVDHTNLSLGFRKGQDEYCTPQGAFLTGKQGEFFSTDMCEGGKQKTLVAKHAEGVAEYCQASNGYAAGATGKKYNQICPKELEKSFLPQFNQGRKSHLTGFITQKEAEITDMDREIADLNRQKIDLQFEIQQLQDNRVLSRKSSYDPNTHQQTEEVSTQTDPSANNEIQSKRWDMQRLDHQITQKRERQNAARSEIRAAQAELITLQ